VVNSKRILDSSVLIAVLNREPYHEDTFDIIPGAVMSSVNSAEVWTKMHEFGLIGDSRIQLLFDLLDEITPFTDSQAMLTGDLRPLTRSKGLSLGDRACLATAIEFQADVYTTERKWAEVSLPCAVHLIR
jgi:PIN domain nuclease of toxin-antitoxin system